LSRAYLKVPHKLYLYMMDEKEFSKNRIHNLFVLRISDCSTSIEEDEIPQKRARNSNILNNPWSFGSPATPRSELFCYPENSPNYHQFNQNLQDFYSNLDKTLPQKPLEESKDTIQVKATAGSSLLMRRLKRLSE